MKAQIEIINIMWEGPLKPEEALAKSIMACTNTTATTPFMG